MPAFLNYMRPFLRAKHNKTMMLYFFQLFWYFPKRCSKLYY